MAAVGFLGIVARHIWSGRTSLNRNPRVEVSEDMNEEVKISGESVSGDISGVVDEIKNITRGQRNFGELFWRGRKRLG